ncbi:SWIM zinc finger family protein [Lactiplantibacillus plantarum]|uniref:SWIM zinc finger family protein n=1 Tax=Lactiplantibacillus plantarum TaxID=1590 RepID=UPI0032E46889
MRQWQTLFQQQVLTRAFNYYQEGHVKKFSKEHHKLMAIVQGVQDYQVTIFESNGDVTTMICNCPYALSGLHCKHMAAVLYYVENTVSIGSQLKMNSPKNCQEKLFKESNDRGGNEWNSDLIQDIRSFTLSQSKLLAHEDMLAVNPCLLFTPLADLSMLFKSCEWLVSTELPRMLAANQQQMVFDILTYAYLKLCYTGVDQTNLIDECARLFRQLLTHADGHIRRSIFRWLFIYSLALPIKYSSQFELLLFYSDAFSNPWFLNQKLILVDHKISKLQASHHEMQFQVETTVIEWQRYRIHVMKELKLSPNTVQEFCQLNRDDLVVSDYFVENCREYNDIERAIMYCRTGIQQAAQDDNSTVMYHCYDQLVSLYRDCGLVNKYRQALFEAITKCDALNSNWYIQLREQYSSADWSNVRRQISASIIPQTDFEWDSFQNVFVRPYVLALQRDVKEATTPESQLSIIKQLEYLQKYHGSTGLEVADWLWQDWYRHYPERKVLMDALDERIAQKIEKD